jgi:hypothetical protein
VSVPNREPLLSPPRRRAFYTLAAVLCLGAAAGFAWACVAGFLADGLNRDVLVSGIKCLMFLTASVVVVREYHRFSPVPS